MVERPLTPELTFCICGKHSPMLCAMMYASDLHANVPCLESGSSRWHMRQLCCAPMGSKPCAMVCVCGLGRGFHHLHDC